MIAESFNVEVKLSNRHLMELVNRWFKIDFVYFSKQYLLDIIAIKINIEVYLYLYFLPIILFAILEESLNGVSASVTISPEFSVMLVKQLTMHLQKER